MNFKCKSHLHVEMMLFGAVNKLIPFSTSTKVFIEIKTLTLKHILYCIMVHSKLLLRFASMRSFWRHIWYFKNIVYQVCFIWPIWCFECSVLKDLALWQKWVFISIPNASVHHSNGKALLKCIVNNQQLQRFFHGFLIFPYELQSFLRWPVFS